MLDGIPLEVRRAVYDHVFANHAAEVGGVLVGAVDARGGPAVHGMIAALRARVGRAGGLTFTHEAWADIIEVQEREFPDWPVIVGWYHSHPGMGIFLSEHDLFIQQNFFREAFQLAWVIDPQAQSEGMFGWAHGNMVLVEEGRTPRRFKGRFTPHDSSLLAPVDAPPTSPPVAQPLGSSVDVRDAFISHAGEDKEVVARPLAEELGARGRSVWFADYELLPSDSLSRCIDEGLRTSTVGVVILSSSFFEKEWPRRELDGLTARSLSGEPNVIVPVWHGVTIDEVRAYSLSLADLMAADTAHGIPFVANQIELLLDRLVSRRRS